MILLLDIETESLLKFISAQKLFEDKFILEFSNNNDDNKIKLPKLKKRRTELTIGGDIACFVKPHSSAKSGLVKPATLYPFAVSISSNNFTVSGSLSTSAIE